MWQYLITPQFERSKKRYDKKRPGELAAVFRNLDRLREQLNGLPRCRASQAGFLHHEPAGYPRCLSLLCRSQPLTAYRLPQR